MNHKVSIIIPLHNAEAYISETLTSCFAQSYTNIEVIVVENGSTDHSFHIVKNLQDHRLQVFRIPTANATTARNYGFKKATGDYLMFLDADDILASNKIEVQLKALDQKPAGWVASCAWAKFSSNITEAEIKAQPVWEVQQPVDWMVNSLTGGGMMIPGCWLIPRNLIEKADLWNEQLSLHDDGEFMCRVLLASKGNVFVKDTVVYYRQVSGSLSRQNQSLKAAESALAVCQSYEQHLLAVQDNDKVRDALAYNYLNLIYELYPSHPKIISTAKKQIKVLGVNPLPEVGSARFKKLVTAIGFNNALRLSGFARQFRKLKS